MEKESDHGDETLDLLDEPTPKKKKRKRTAATTMLAPDEYVVRSSKGQEVFVSIDLFECSSELKKLPAGYEIIRRSDGEKLYYNTRQRAADNLIVDPLLPRR